MKTRDSSNHLGTALLALLDKHKLSQRAFAKKCGLNHATLHHVFHGTPCSRENLRLFCAHISDDPSEKFAILAAHLLDEAEASGLDTSQLVIRSVGEVTLGELRVSPVIRRHLTLVAAEAEDHQDVRRLLASLADLIVRNRTP